MCVQNDFFWQKIGFTGQNSQNGHFFTFFWKKKFKKIWLPWRPQVWKNVEFFRVFWGKKNVFSKSKNVKKNLKKNIFFYNGHNGTLDSFFFEKNDALFKKTWFLAYVDTLFFRVFYIKFSMCAKKNLKRA